VRIFILTILLPLSASLSCQTISDTLFFANDEEKVAFNLKSVKDHFELLALIGSESDPITSKKYDDFITFLTGLEKKFKNKKPTKRINEIYDAIHEKYFIKYVENPRFLDIFEKKEYNCVTATGMYAIAFEFLNIPYSIRQVPSHVYIIAFPKTHRIIIETTDPVNGSFSINSKKLNQYKDELINSKTISKNESNDFDTEQIFEQFILGDSSITLSNLVGIQYYNHSLIEFEIKKYRNAFWDSRKAQVLYKNEFVDAWSGYLCASLIEAEYEKLTANEIHYCAKRIYDAILVEDNALMLIKNYYLELAKLIIVNGNDIEKFIAINNNFEESIAENIIYKEVYDFGNFLAAEYYIKAINHSKALNLMAKSYNVDDPNYNYMVQSVLGEHLGAIRNASDGLDSLAKFELIFPFVITNQTVQEFGVWCYQKLIYNSFELNESSEAFSYLAAFEEKYSKNDDLKFPDDFIGNIYGSASSYHVRKNDYKKAKSYFYLKQELI